MRELLMFGIVGTVNTAFGYGVYALCLYLGTAFQVASAVSMLSSIAVGFFGHGYIVFESAAPNRLIRYVAMWFGLLVLYTFIVRQSLSLGHSPYIGGLIAMPFVIGASFLTQKYFVFRK